MCRLQCYEIVLGKGTTNSAATCVDKSASGEGAGHLRRSRGRLGTFFMSVRYHLGTLMTQPAGARGKSPRNPLLFTMRNAYCQPLSERSLMNMSLLSKSAGRVLIAGALAATCVAFAGCSSADKEQSAEPAEQTSTDAATADNAATSDEQSDAAALKERAADEDMATLTSTALVVYVNDDEVAFVDQATDTLYIPTLPDDAVFNQNGQEIDDDQLVVGNIVSVTGNGIMLESYPAQYPGISKVQVIEQGDPAEADKYAQELETVFAGPDAGAVPTGVAEYSTSLGQVSLPLTAYQYELTVEGPDKELEGDFHMNGILNSDVIDARIDAATPITATFTADVAKVEVERTAVQQNEQGGWTLQASPDENVTVTAEGKTANFTMEPGFAYEIDVDFADGTEASYAFVAVN